MNYAAITSMNEEYYNICGKDMLNSFKKHWSGLMKLYLFNETPIKFEADSIKKVGWNLGQDYKDFIERHADDASVTKFAKKAFPIINAMSWMRCDRLIWSDADVIFKSAPPRQLLDLIAPDDVLSTHFEVRHLWPSKEDATRISVSCETGFFILNKRHPQFNEFAEIYKDIYINDRSDNLRRFYDGEVYGKTVQLMEAKGAKMLNLTTGYHKTPITRSVLGPYLTHRKAGAKYL